ncbi:MAG: hypothetical protein CMJ89_04130 [Planctomycetes bacterium]|nr:hypothetical protein [Planctomycetota bacterium]
MRFGIDLSIIVVNYNTGELLLSFLESLSTQTTLRLERIVVDNASTEDPHHFLETAEGLADRVLRSPENLGYAGGCNLGLSEASGRFVVFANADTRVLGRALETLVKHLEAHPKTGLAEPRTYLDDEKTFFIPEFRALGLRDLIDDALLRTFPNWARGLHRRRLQDNLACWRCNEPRRQTALTGAFIAARRETIVSLGGFDTDYPLYFEDQDLFARMRRAGHQLVQIPEAEVVHYAHRSTITDLENAEARYAAGRRRYLRRHCGWSTDLFDRGLARIEPLVARLHPNSSWLRRFRDLGELTEAPSFPIEGSGNHVIELAIDPYFVLSAGAFGSGERFFIHRAAWNSLLPTAYYLRAWDASGSELRAAYRFRKLQAPTAGAD